MPLCAIRQNRPAVLSTTVLPPVFGPVTTSVRTAAPAASSIGTVRSPSAASSSGWRAPTRLSRPSSSKITGSTIAPSSAYTARAQIASSSAIAAVAVRSSPPRPAHAVRERAQDAPRLLALGEDLLAQDVVHLDDRLRLDEHRLPAGRAVVDDAGHGAAAAGLHRDDVAVLAQRDDRLLDRRGVRRLPHQPLQRAHDVAAGAADPAAQAQQLVARVVADLPLRGQAAADLPLDVGDVGDALGVVRQLRAPLGADARRARCARRRRRTPPRARDPARRSRHSRRAAAPGAA